MNTLMKRSIANLICLAILILASLVYYQTSGKMFNSSLIFWFLLFPNLLTQFVVFPPHREPEIDERDRDLMQKAMLIGLGLSWICIVVGLSYLGIRNQSIDAAQLTYILPLGLFLIILGRDSSFCFFSKRGLSL